MTHKEFYIWLEGYLYGKLENKHIEITPIVEKMGQVKDEQKLGITEPYRVPIPINPFPQTNNPPLTPPWTITCGDKTQLND
jgi:hypothetical protein